MVIASLAWSLKASLALSLSPSPECPDNADADAEAEADAERNQILRMGFRAFVRNFMLVPTQILYKGRQLIYRALAWRSGLTVMFRAAECST